MFNYDTKNINTTKFTPLAPYPDYFFSLNKWPIDKAPKVSNSSYLVGFGFFFLFITYAYQTIDNFVLFSYSWFNYSLQFPALALLIATYLTVSREWFWPSVFFLLFFFFFFFFGYNVTSAKHYRYYQPIVSTHLVLNWDVFLFLFFFFGWVYKVGKKYMLESYTFQESFFYKTAVPSVYLFEVTTFLVILAWRYLNQGLSGYSSVMYLKFYKFQFVTSVLLSKLIFFAFVYSFFFFLLSLLKVGARLSFFFFYLLLFLVLTVFLFKEFNEFWSFVHQASPSNTLKFTYFKFVIYIMFFNFLHVYLVAGFSLLGFFIYIFKFNAPYSDFYELVYINIKNYYLIMWLTVILFLSIYLINDCSVYLGYSLVSYPVN